MGFNNLDDNNMTIEEKIELIKEKEKFKLIRTNSLDEMEVLEDKKELGRIELLNKKLDEEIAYIYSKIDSSNKKWILDDFRNYLYENNDNYSCARIYHHKYAKELRKRLKQFENKDKENNYKIAVIDKIDYRSSKIDKDLDKEKVITLLKSWIFFSNTTVEYNKTKAFPKDFNKSLMYRIKISIVMFIGISISVAAFIAVVLGLVFASESFGGAFGIDDIFIFNIGGSRRSRRNRRNDRRYGREQRRNSDKENGLTTWFNNMKESFLY